MFSVLRTELHAGRVGQCPTRSQKTEFSPTHHFFALLVTQFGQPADMEEENPVKRGQELLKYWGGKSLHPIDIVYQLKCVQLT